MNTPSRLVCAVLLMSAVTLQGCATGSSSGSVYTRGQAQREQIVRMGTVETVREVTIDAGQTGAGTLAGGAIGGIAAGSTIGRGSGSVAAGILGAIVGGIAGSTVEGQVAKRRGIEVTVRLDNGEMRAITQEADELFRPGERVRLLSSGGVTRVTH
jgi:outer membrane lipoprotein SlyB